KQACAAATPRRVRAVQGSTPLTASERRGSLDRRGVVRRETDGRQQTRTRSERRAPWLTTPVARRRPTPASSTVLLPGQRTPASHIRASTMNTSVVRRRRRGTPAAHRGLSCAPYFRSTVRAMHRTYQARAGFGVLLLAATAMVGCGDD